MQVSQLSGKSHLWIPRIIRIMFADRELADQELVRHRELAAISEQPSEERYAEILDVTTVI